MRLYGLVGCRISYTLSPHIHNTVFRLLNVDAKYDVIDISEDVFDIEILKVFEKYSGLNVTIPYKVRILKYIDKFTEEALQVGAINTIKIDNGVKIGHNTDIYGIERALKRYGIDISGSVALILGAGGAARAAVYIFNKLKVSKIIVANRSRERSLELKNHFKKFGIDVEIVDWDSRVEYAEKADVIINCTPVGTLSSESPLPQHVFKPGKVVIDMVYRPRITKMLEYARERGCKIVDGLTILIYQALVADEFWLDVKIGDDIFEEVENSLMKIL